MKAIRNWIRDLYAWTTKWAQKKNAEYALAGLTAAEGIFFPIPTDPLMMAMTFTKPQKWFRYSLITLISSILGGIVGYLIGWGLFESIGQPIIDALHLHEEFIDFSQAFNRNGASAVFIAAVTPIPYKLITLSAGAVGVNFGVFVAASIIGRGARFMLLGFLASHLGAKYKDQIEKYIDIIGLAAAGILLVLLFISSR